MADHPLAVNGAPLSLWVSFALPVLVLLALDLGLFLRSGRDPSVKQSVAWIAIWASLAGVFGIALTSTLGASEGLAFLTGYVVEQALSVDNLFVFLLVFGQLAVPKQAQKRALAYGILGALVLRIGMLAAGGAFIARFHALGWVLGALLVIMGVKAARELRAGAKKRAEQDAHEDEAPRAGTAARMIEGFVPLSEHFDGDRFTTKVGGRTYATPLVLAVVSILLADVVFAVDSIPAVLAVSTNPIVVVTSNVFAVLGLRSMFFVLQGLMARLEYLPHGLAAVLVVVGVKMLLGSIVTIPTVLSLASVLAVLGVAVFFSLASTKGTSHAQRS